MTATTGGAIGDVLPAAVAVALSPLPICATILLLIGARGRAAAGALVVGWILGLLVVGTIVIVVLGDAATTDAGATSDGIGWAKVALGALLLVLAVRNWRQRPRPGHEPSTPKWMTTLDDLGAAKAFGAGVALAAVNPKNLVLTLAASASIASADVGGGAQAVALVVFVVVATIGVAAPFAVALAGGAQVQARLESGRTWLVANNHTVLAVVLVVLGAKVLGDGLGILG